MSRRRIIFTGVICGVVLTFISVPDVGATVVNIDGSVSGYDPLAHPGSRFINPVQITLPAGTYLVSDAFGLPGATFGAYNEHKTAMDDWVWHYVIGIATGKVLRALGSPLAYRTETAAETAGRATSAVTFSLPGTTTLDFAVYDSYIPDSSGGISLSITPIRVPEPASIGVFAMAIGLLGWTVSRRIRR